MSKNELKSRQKIDSSNLQNLNDYAGTTTGDESIDNENEADSDVTLHW